MGCGIRWKKRRGGSEVRNSRKGKKPFLRVEEAIVSIREFLGFERLSDFFVADESNCHGWKNKIFVRVSEMIETIDYVLKGGRKRKRIIKRIRSWNFIDGMRDNCFKRSDGGGADDGRICFRKEVGNKGDVSHRVRNELRRGRGAEKGFRIEH